MYFKTCPICNNPVPVSGKQKRTYCSVACMSKGYREQLKGKNNPNYRHGPSFCKICNKKLGRNTKGDTCIDCVDRSGENNNFFGKKHSEESLVKMQSWERPKGENHHNFGMKHSEKAKKLMSTARRQNWVNSTPEYKQKVTERLMRNTKSQGDFHITKPERFVRDYLTEEKMGFERNELMYGKFLVDFLLDNGNIIEVFGDYWHGNPVVFPNPTPKQLKQKAKDKSRLAYLAACGRKVIVIWENEIKHNKEAIREIIKNLK